MSRQYRGTCGCGWTGSWCNTHFVASGEASLHQKDHGCDESADVQSQPKPQQAGYDEDGELITDGGVDQDDEFDGGASIIEVDGYESYVDPEHLDSCERAGAEVREE